MLYSPRTVNIKPATSFQIDIELILFPPKNAKGFITSIHRGDEITELNGDKQRLWVEILTKYYEEGLKIKRNWPVGLLLSNLNT